MRPPAHVPTHQPPAAACPASIPISRRALRTRRTVARDVVARCPFPASGSVLRTLRKDVHRLAATASGSSGSIRWKRRQHRKQGAQ